MLGWLWWTTAMGAGPSDTPAERLEACGNDELAAAVDSMSKKERRVAVFEAATEHLEWKRYLCAADLTHLVLTTYDPKPADQRRVAEMLTVTRALAYDGPAREALYEARFDEAEAMYRHLAALGHDPSAETVRTLAGLERRRWRHDRAEDALEAGRPRHAQRLLAPVIEGEDHSALSPRMKFEEVEKLYARIEAAVAADDALVAKEKAEDASCWSTLTGQPPKVEVVGGCDEGTSELLRERHAKRVEIRRGKPRDGTEQLTTSHR